MTRRQPPSRHQVNFPLPEPLRVRLRLAAAVTGKSQATMVAEAVTRYLDALPKHIQDGMTKVREARDKESS